EAALQQATDALCRAGDARLARDRAAVETLAAALTPSRPRRSRALMARMARFHALHPDFRTVIAVDSAGAIVAASPDVGVDGTPTVGRTVADRAYFRAPMAGVPGASPSFVSDAFRGRGFGSAPIVGVSAAVRDSSGRPLGIVSGSLDLEAFAGIARGARAGEGSAFAIVDRAGRVILGGEALGQRLLAAAAGHPLVVAARATPAGAAFRADTDGGRVFGAHCTTALGWLVVGREPTAQLDRGTREAFALTLGWAVLAAAGAAAAATALARRLAGM
ncbi:cache domain-containing protein, partial [Roseisolibacter sp. H3M3-2]|uniref:cache domain-containing protein n=1 Tax=Roseisolibacter sp. H3M3-2 TaxID=3031323 RepID=UPI0023DBCF45